LLESELVSESGLEAKHLSGWQRIRNRIQDANSSGSLPHDIAKVRGPDISIGRRTAELRRIIRVDQVNGFGTSSLVDGTGIRPPSDEAGSPKSESRIIVKSGSDIHDKGEVRFRFLDSTAESTSGGHFGIGP
jgi:hypothetical protein